MRKRKTPTLVYGNYYHVYTPISYLGIAECRLVNGQARFVQKLNLFSDDSKYEERECMFITDWVLATDYEIKNQDKILI